MENEGYIAQKEEGSSLFEELYLEALEIVQKLCGDVWTDYNEHDPGVTLLENMAYALTELTHKAELPVQDLLIRAEDKPLRSGDNALFTASDILTNGPVTFNDYRKIWIDQVTNVKDVWIRRVNAQKDQRKNSEGLLHVFVEKYEYRSDPEKESEENQKIIQDITTLYQTHRNLCEDLYTIEVCKALEMTITFKATLDHKANGETVLAEILYRINDYLTPAVNYYPLWKLQQQHLAVNTIFNGPQLNGGFILEEELREPLEEIVLLEIVRFLSKIPGIVSITDFFLHYTVPKTGEVQLIHDRFVIPKDTVVKVSFPESNEDLTFKHEGVRFKPDLTRAKKQFSRLVAANYRSFDEASNAFNNLPIPKGQYRDITAYYPIRKQLPELYGVGDRGISPQAPALRQAQVRQLKAYLMPFDQLMVNFLAQLRHVYTLFDPYTIQETSYFTQVLPDIDQLIDLIQQPKEDHDLEDIKIYWKRVLDDINARFDTRALKRYHQVTDHLLARFSEVFRTYPLSKIQSISYGVPIYTEDSEKALLAAKRKLLREYATISYRRAQAFQYSHIAERIAATGQCTQTQLLPGALQKTAILSGMSDFVIRSLTQPIENSGITIHPKTIQIELIVRDIIFIEEGKEILETEDVEINISEAVEEDLYRVMHYTGPHDTILEETLAHGVHSQNYEIRKSSEKKEYYVLYKRGSDSSVAHIAPSQEEAQNTVQKAIAYLSEISRKSEGFFAVEHLLLLPPYQGAHYGFQIDFTVLSEALDIQVRQHQKASCLERNKAIVTLKDQLFANTLIYNSVQKGGYYHLEIRSSEDQPLAISTTQYPSATAVEQHIEALKRIAPNIQESLWDAAVKRYAYYGQNQVDERFFTFQLSLIVPTWPTRFQNENFKKMFKNILYEQLPIHIKSAIYWLNYTDLRRFEAHYFSWIQHFSGAANEKEQMHHAYQLVTLLQDIIQQHEI